MPITGPNQPTDLRRPDDPPNAVITPGYVFTHSDGKIEISQWHVKGEWPWHTNQDGVDLYFGYTVEELRAIAERR